MNERKIIHSFIYKTFICYTVIRCLALFQMPSMVAHDNNDDDDDLAL